MRRLAAIKPASSRISYWRMCSARKLGDWNSLTAFLIQSEFRYSTRWMWSW